MECKLSTKNFGMSVSLKGIVLLFPKNFINSFQHYSLEKKFLFNNIIYKMAHCNLPVNPHQTFDNFKKSQYLLQELQQFVPTLWHGEETLVQ